MKKIVQILTITSMLLAWGNQSIAMRAGPQTTQKLYEARRAIGAQNWVTVDRIIKELRAEKRTKEADSLTQELKQAMINEGKRAIGAQDWGRANSIISELRKRNQNKEADSLARAVQQAHGGQDFPSRLPTSIISEQEQALITLVGGIAGNIGDANFIIQQLLNFLGGQPAGIITVDDAIQKLNQWTGNPMGGNYDPAIGLPHPQGQGTSPFNPVNQALNLGAIIVPGWNIFQPLLLKSSQSNGTATDAINNLGILLGAISSTIVPTGPGPVLNFDSYDNTLNNILRTCGTLGSATQTAAVDLVVAQQAINVILKLGGTTANNTITAAADLNIAAANLLTLVNNLEGDLGTGGHGGYDLANIAGNPRLLPAVDIAALSDARVKQVSQDLDPALAAFLTDAAGAPADQAAAVAKVQAFQGAVDAIYPTHPGNAQDLNTLLPIINDITVIARKTMAIQNKLTSTGYTRGGNISVIGVPALREILNGILDIS